MHLEARAAAFELNVLVHGAHVDSSLLDEWENAVVAETLFFQEYADRAKEGSS